MLSLLNWNGNLLSVTLPKEPISGRLKIKQYEAYMDEIKRYRIAEEIILTKINKSRCGHEWVPRDSKEPKVCPKCKSPYWDRPKKM